MICSVERSCGGFGHLLAALKCDLQDPRKSPDKPRTLHSKVIGRGIFPTNLRCFERKFNANFQPVLPGLTPLWNATLEDPQPLHDRDKSLAETPQKPSKFCAKICHEIGVNRGKKGQPPDHKLIWRLGVGLFARSGGWPFLPRLGVGLFWSKALAFFPKISRAATWNPALASFRWLDAVMWRFGGFLGR